MALLEEPEEIGGVFGGRCGCAFWEDGFPEAFQFCGSVFAYPFHHFAGTWGEYGIGCEGVRPGGAGEEFAFAFEDGHVLGFEGFADSWDENGCMFAEVVTSAFESGEQARREVFGRDGGGDVCLAAGFEGFIQKLGSNGAFELGAVGEPFDVGGGRG